MLEPAILHADELRKKIMKYIHTDDMIYYTGCLSCSVPIFNDDIDGGLYEYAIVDKGKLIGYFTYRIDWYVSCVSRFGLFSFDERNNQTVGIDVYRELRKLINQYHIHRMEWRMVGGNPVEKHYDRFCKKYHGNKFVLTDAIKDRTGKYHNDIIYEIIFSRNLKDSEIPQSANHGKWVICSDGYYPYCSECGCEPRSREMTNFCAECGAKMDKE